MREDKVPQEIFTFERLGVTDAGKVQGRFRATGSAPKLLDRLRVSGIQLPQNIFLEAVPQKSGRLERHFAHQGQQVAIGIAEKCHPQLAWRVFEIVGCCERCI